MCRYAPASPVSNTNTLAPSKRKKTTASSSSAANIVDADPSPAVENVENIGTQVVDNDNTNNNPPSDSSSSYSSSSSDSDWNSRAYIQKLKMASASQTTAIAMVEHHSLHHAPILTSGIPTPSVLLEFEDACEDFFANAKGGVVDDMKVTRILPSFKDPIIRGWISSDRVHLSKLSFQLFMAGLHSKFLAKEWEDELLSKILRNHLRPGQSFMTWATMLQQQNCVLRNTPSQLDEKRLREQISIAIDGELRIAGREAKVNEAESLRDFLHIYSVCDEKRKAAETRTRSIIEDAYRKSKMNNKENSFHPYKKDGRSSASTGVASSSGSRPPKLTTEEKDIIKANFGCYKCRKLFQSKDHISADPDKRSCDFPSGENYRPLTWDYANKLKQIRSAKKGSSSGGTVAATSSSTPLAVVLPPARL